MNGRRVMQLLVSWTIVWITLGAVIGMVMGLADTGTLGSLVLFTFVRPLERFSDL
ncbi:MAG: hypothetical protein ACREQK_14705 [Candidatus Binatia bacterium]